MIKGFEQYTEDLTAYERSTLLNVLVKSMALRRGKENAIKGAAIVQILKDRDKASGEGRYKKVTEQRIKKVLSYIRINNLVPGLMATQDGYFVAVTLKDMETYIDSLTGRINAINALRDTAIQNYISMGGIIGKQQSETI